MPNWQPDMLFRKEMEIFRKIFVCDLSNFQICRHQPEKKCSAIFACVSGTIKFLLSDSTISSLSN